MGTHTGGAFPKSLLDGERGERVRIACPPDFRVSQNPGSSTRQRILREAARLFATIGYRAATTRKIAQTVGIRQPSLFHHFPSKRAILDELLTFDLDLTLDYSGCLLTSEGSAAVRLYRYIHWDLNCCIESPYDMRGLSASGHLDQPGYKKWKGKKDGLHENLRRLIEQGIEAREFVPCDAEWVREAITALTVETIRLRDTLPFERRHERPHEVASFVLRSLLIDPACLEKVRAQATNVENQLTN